MKKTMTKIKKYAQTHEEELTRQLYYVVGCAAGLTAAYIYNKESYKHFGKRHPEFELILKDSQGYFHGFNRINVEE